MVLDIANFENIKEQVKEVIKYSQDLPCEVNIDDLFLDWFRNKMDFIQAWEGELIKDLGEVTVHFNDEQKEQAIGNLIDQIDWLYSNQFEFEDYIECEKLIKFIRDNQGNFFTNLLNEDYNTGLLNIKKGTKIVRSFKYFCQNKELLEIIQNLASRVIQEDKIMGHLCLSVHPLDYLSISENAHNWRSCHALDGEYRSGNLNYMADYATFICYLKADGEYELPNFPPTVKWNSKKWRVLLYRDQYDQLLMASRQYPFNCPELLLQVKHEVEKIFNCTFSGWFNKYVTSIDIKAEIDDNDFTDNLYTTRLRKKYIPCGDKLISYHKVVKDGEDTYQFNDLILSSFYKDPYYAMRLQKSYWNGTTLNTPVGYGSDIPRIVVGKSCKCVSCHDENIALSDSMICPHCMIKYGQVDDEEVFDTCPICGQYFWLEEGKFWENDGIDQYVCPECAESLQAEKEEENC